MLKTNWYDEIFHDKTWKKIKINYNNSVFEIIMHCFGYNNYRFYYETLCNITPEEKKEIEQYLIQYFKEEW